MASKGDKERNLMMKHHGFLDLEIHRLKKKCRDIPWTWTHTNSKKENRLLIGDKNITKGVNTKREIVIEKESSKQT